MSELETAITIVEIVAGVAAAMLLGDYLGYKIGRLRLAVIVGVIVLVALVVFAVYSGVVLA
jgi:hypothetical protein